MGGCLPAFLLASVICTAFCFPPCTAAHCTAPCTAVLQACTSAMNLAEEVDLEDYVARPDKINNAEIASICQVGGRVCRWAGGRVGGRGGGGGGEGESIEI